MDIDLLVNLEHLLFCCSWPAGLLFLVDTNCNYDPMYFKHYRHIFTLREKTKMSIAQAETQMISPILSGSQNMKQFINLKLQPGWAWLSGFIWYIQDTYIKKYVRKYSGYAT